MCAGHGGPSSSLVSPNPDKLETQSMDVAMLETPPQRETAISPEHSADAKRTRYQGKAGHHDQAEHKADKQHQADPQTSQIPENPKTESNGDCNQKNEFTESDQEAGTGVGGLSEHRYVDQSVGNSSQPQFVNRYVLTSFNVMPSFRFNRMFKICQTNT